MENTFKKQIKTLADEITQLGHENIEEWVGEYVLDIQNNYNELIITVGGPSIRIYIDCGVIRGQQGFSSDPVFMECNTSVFEDYFNAFKK